MLCLILFILFVCFIITLACEMSMSSMQKYRFVDGWDEVWWRDRLLGLRFRLPVLRPRALTPKTYASLNRIFLPQQLHAIFTLCAQSLASRTLGPFLGTSHMHILAGPAAGSSAGVAIWTLVTLHSSIVPLHSKTGCSSLSFRPKWETGASKEEMKMIVEMEADGEEGRG